MMALGLAAYALTGDNLGLMGAALLSRVLCFFLLLAHLGDMHAMSNMLKIFNRQPKHECLHRRDSESQDSDSLLPGSSSASPPLKPSALYRPSGDSRVAVRVHVLCTIVYVGATLWMAFHVNRTTSAVNADEFCIHHISQYCKPCVKEDWWQLVTLTAPVVRDVTPNWHVQLFNGSFLHQNVYRQSAGPEVDAAWDALGINCKCLWYTDDLC